eukprot:10996070-Heterocapsa_arctica.AAC.1
MEPPAEQKPKGLVEDFPHDHFPEVSAADQAIDQAATDRAAINDEMSREGITEGGKKRLIQQFNLANSRFWEAHAAKRRLI